MFSRRDLLFDAGAPHRRVAGSDDGFEGAALVAGIALHRFHQIGDRSWRCLSCTSMSAKA